MRRSFRDRLPGPLLDYDERHGSALLPTREVFLAASGSWRMCAAQLHVHVNTLRYRIQRIQHITGRDLGTLEKRVDFFLATRADGGDRSWPVTHPAARFRAERDGSHHQGSPPFPAGAEPVNAEADMCAPDMAVAS